MNTHSRRRHTVHSTHGHTATALDTHIQKRDRTHNFTHTHTPPKDSTLRNTLRETARSHGTQKHRDTRSHAYTHTPASPEAVQSCGVDEGGGCPRRPRRPRRLQRATGGGAVRPPRARPGPPGRTPHPAPPPGCSRGPVPARWPGLTALPSSRPRRAPQPPAAAPTPRWALRAPAPAPRRPGAVSDPPPANAALNSRNNKQPDMSESAAAGPPSLAAKPQARPDRGGNGRRQDNLFRGPRAPRAHPRDTHTTRPAPPPRAAPARGTHSSRGPGEDHTRNIPGHAASLHEHTHIRSRHAPTHAFPAHSAFTGTHAAPGRAHRRPQTHVHIAHTARGHTRSGPVPTPSHTYTDLTSTHIAHTSSAPHAGRIHRALFATRRTKKHKPFSDTQQTTLQARAHTNAQKCNTSAEATPATQPNSDGHTTDIQSYLAPHTHYTEADTTLGAHPMPLCTQHSPQHTRGHTTHTAPFLAHPSDTFAGTPPPEHTIAHPTLKTHREQARHVRSSNTPTFFRDTPPAPRLGGANWVRPTRAYLPESRSRVRRAGR